MRAGFLAGSIWVLIAAGTFLSTTGLLDYWESHSAQREIAKDWRADDSNARSPEISSPAVPDLNVRPGAPVAKLTIPRLDTALFVVEGVGARELKRGPGHLTGTALPGKQGNCVIAGHRDTHFRVLRNIRDGDEVILERDGRAYRYRVDGINVVTPDNTSSLQPADKGVLNLITCYPFYYLGSAPKRFIVHAGLEDSGLAAAR